MRTLRHVAFLRAINVGGRRVTGDELAQVFLDHGAITASSYLASGNVIFDTATEPTVAGIEAALRDRLGYEVPTFLRTADEIRALAGCRPFDDAALAGAGKPQVLFLRQEMPAGAVAKVRSLAPTGELLDVIGREAHWLPAAGTTDSDLDLHALEDLIGLYTMRTATTISRLSKKFL